MLKLGGFWRNGEVSKCSRNAGNQNIGMEYLFRTCDAELDGQVDLGLGVDLALVDAAVPGLHIFNFQVPVLGIGRMDHREALVTGVGVNV